MELHAFGAELTGKLFGRRLEDVKRDFQRVSAQIADIVEDAFSKAPRGLSLETVEVSLGFSAAGKLAFVAEAGVEATLSVKFKKA